MSLRRIFVLIFISLFLKSCMNTRGGNDLYKDLLGKQAGDCTKILYSKDREALDDASAYIHFITCPIEIKRILKNRKYESQKIAKKLANEAETVTYGGFIPKWWTPSKLGDSCYSYTYFDKQSGWAEHLYISLDSTKVFYQDTRY